MPNCHPGRVSCPALPKLEPISDLVPACTHAWSIWARAAAFQSSQSPLVRAQSENKLSDSEAARLKKINSGNKMLRRHSSGDHAFLPSRTDRDAIKAANKNFGVPHTLAQDGEGSRLPTTRGY